MKKAEIVIKLHKPDASEMLFFFACGVVISIPLTLFIYQYTDALLIGLDPLIVTLISRTFFAPLIEEFSKAYPIFYRHGETQRSLFDLATLVGLGFGLVETLTYVSVLGAPIIYRLPGLLFHPASNSIIAYGITIKRSLPFYLFAVLLHFLNNYFALTSSFPLLGSIFVVTITIFTSWRLRTRTKEKIVI